jgi:hypothetical protein
MPEENFGLIPSPPDERDYLLSQSPAMLEIKRVPQEIPFLFDFPVTNQGSNPSCVGHAGGLVKQFLELKEKEFIRPDREWLYAECKKIDGIPDFKGTYFRAVLKVLRDTGCKLEGQNNDPSIYRIGEYRKVDDLSFEGIQKAIALWGHMLAGYRGSNIGWRGEFVRPPQTGEAIWNHAIFTGGYSIPQKYTMGQNSWGEGAHIKGVFKAPHTYSPFEAWVVTVDKINEPRGSVRYGWVAVTKWTQPTATYLNNNNEVLPELGLRIREKPGLSQKILYVLPKGTRVRPAIGENVSVLDNFMEDRIVDGYSWRCIIL